MAAIIVITDFSETARNALEYACSFSAASTKIRLLLVNISLLPASFSGDGVTMAANSDSIRDKTERLQEETGAVMINASQPPIAYKALLGKFYPNYSGINRRGAGSPDYSGYAGFIQQNMGLGDRCIDRIDGAPGTRFNCSPREA